MSALSDYLNAHMNSAGWTKRDLIKAVQEEIDRTTVYRYLAGSHSANPAEYVLQAFARALPGASLVELREAAGLAAGEEEPWVLPPEAQRLTRAQRNAIEILIRSIANAPEPSESVVSRKGREAVRVYAEDLRASGQDELADRLEASLEITSPASHTASKSSNA